MGVPQVKIYQLPQGYSQDADTDIQRRANDELLPLVPKLTLLSDVNGSTPLTGVVLVSKATLIPFALNSGTASVYALVESGTKPGYYVATGKTWATDILFETLGVLAPVIKSSGGVVQSITTYTVTTDGIKFVGTFPAGSTITCFLKAAIGATTTFAMVSGDTFYRGANATWNRLLVSKDAAEYVVTTMPTDGVGYLTVSSVATSLKATYAVTRAATKTFIAEDPNWIGGHTTMWPDVFVGVYDYPGDQYTNTSGTPVNPGTMPLFRDPGTYQANFRDGTIDFPEVIDSAANPVRANYAHLAGVANVTGQKLTAVTGTGNTQFKADTEALFTDSHGKRWVTRNDQYTPTNVYVDGVLTPQPQSVLPYDDLSIKLS